MIGISISICSRGTPSPLPSLPLHEKRMNSYKMSQWMCKGTAERPMWQGQSDIQENNGTPSNSHWRHHSWIASMKVCTKLSWKNNNKLFLILKPSAKSPSPQMELLCGLGFMDTRETQPAAAYLPGKPRSLTLWIFCVISILGGSCV